MKEKKRKNFTAWTILSEQKYWFLLYILITIISFGLNIYSVILTADFVEVITQVNDGTAHINAAITLLIIICVLIVISKVFENILFQLTYVISSRSQISTRKKIFDRLLIIDSETYANTYSGTFINRILLYPRAIIEQFTYIAFNVAQIISAIVIIIYLATLNVWISVTILVGMALMFLWEYFRVKSYKKMQKEYNQSNEKVSSITNEIIRSERDIKALNMEESVKALAYANSEENNRYYAKFKMRSELYYGVTSHLMDFIIIGCMLVALFMFKAGALAFPALMFVYMYKGNLNSFTYNFRNIIDDITDERNYIGFINDFFDDNKFTKEEFGDVELDECKGNIKFKNVCFKYSGTMEDGKENKHVINNINFEIKANTTVAFVGHSGSGKSTILNLISKYIR